MNWTNVPAGMVNAATQRFWGAIGDDADLVAHRMKNDSAFVDQVTAFMQNGGFQPSISQQRARDIMGRNCFDILKASRHFDVNLSKRQLAALSGMPFSEEILETVRDTHILVAVLPISILDIHERENSLFFCGYDDPWYSRSFFAIRSGDIGWHLVRKTRVLDSTMRTWGKQQVLLSGAEEVPTARVMVYTMIGHYLATGERLFEDVWVRTSSPPLRVPERISVGRFDQQGLRVSSVDDDKCDGLLGVSSAYKFQV